MTRRLRNDGDRVEWTRAGNGTSLRIAARGRVEFTDDDRDVKDIAGNGYFEISEQGRSWFFRPDGRRYIVRRIANGELSRRFIVNGTDQPIDAAARDWIGGTTQAFVRDSGFNVEMRVARLLATKGATAVLDEIAQISGDFVQARYFIELTRQVPADTGTIERTLRQAARDIDSDFELARTVIAVANTVTVDETLAPAFIEATRSIGSDFEHARTLIGLLQKFRESNLVEKVVLESVTTIQSDFERQRVLSTLAVKRDLSDRTVIGIIQSASLMKSDFEKARVLLRLLDAQSVAAAVKPELVKAVDSIASEHERGRVLEAMLRRGRL